MNEEPEKMRLPIRVSAVTPPTVRPVKSPGPEKSEGKALISWAGILQVAPWSHMNSVLAGPPGAAELILSDGPERKKLSRSLPKLAAPVNVKLSARAALAKKQTIAKARTADLNDSALMKPPNRRPQCRRQAPTRFHASSSIPTPTNNNGTGCQGKVCLLLFMRQIVNRLFACGAVYFGCGAWSSASVTTLRSSISKALPRP